MVGESTLSTQVGEARGPEGSDGPEPTPRANSDARNDACIGPPRQIHLPSAPGSLPAAPRVPRGAGVAQGLVARRRGGGSRAEGELGRSAEHPRGSRPPSRSPSLGAILPAPHTLRETHGHTTAGVAAGTHALSVAELSSQN